MSESKGIVGSCVAAMLSIVAASSCCLPIGALVASGGLAAAGEWMAQLRPYFFLLSAACLGWAIWRIALAPRCERKSALEIIFVGIASLVVAAMFLLPQQMANLLANLITTK